MSRRRLCRRDLPWKFAELFLVNLNHEILLLRATRVLPHLGFETEAGFAVGPCPVSRDGAVSRGVGAWLKSAVPGADLKASGARGGWPTGGLVRPQLRRWLVRHICFNWRLMSERVARSMSRRQDIYGVTFGQFRLPPSGLHHGIWRTTGGVATVVLNMMLSFSVNGQGE